MSLDEYSIVSFKELIFKKPKQQHSLNSKLYIIKETINE